LYKGVLAFFDIETKETPTRILQDVNLYPILIATGAGLS
jgi:hypothetical protein